MAASLLRLSRLVSGSSNSGAPHCALKDVVHKRRQSCQASAHHIELNWKRGSVACCCCCKASAHSTAPSTATLASSPNDLITTVEYNLREASHDTAGMHQGIAQKVPGLHTHTHTICDIQVSHGPASEREGFDSEPPKLLPVHARQHLGGLPRAAAAGDAHQRPLDAGQ